MKEAELDILMQQNRMVKLIKSKFPTWVTEQKDEGIELVAGKFNAFRITKEGERDYNITCSQHVQIILDILQEKPEQKTEQQPATAGAGHEEKEIALIPDMITSALLEKWKKMSTFDRMLMFQKTAAQNIKKRKGRGGEYNYVEGNLMKQEANIAFLFAVSSKIDGWQIDEKGVSCYGSLTVNIDGKDVTVSDVGIDLQETNSKTGQPVFTVHEMMKNACTDMKKRCLACMGFNGDVYRGEV